jgi:hypothetical protein
VKTASWILSVVLAAWLLGSSAELFAHSAGSEDDSDRMIVTRHFSGIWDQVEQQSQGLAIQVVERIDDSRKSVVYWYTYGADRKTAWFVGVGDLVDNRIDFELFESTDVGFMQDAVPGSDTVESIGSMTIVFDSCDRGVVTFETSDDKAGSGSFKIERLAEIMNTHCTGGISDDMHAYGMFGDQFLELDPARQGIAGKGLATYEDYPGHMEFEVEVEGLPDGSYHLYVGTQIVADFEVSEGYGEVNFASPAEDGDLLLNFDPRGEQIDVQDDDGVVLSSFDNTFEEDDYNHHGPGDGEDHDDDHHYDCESGMGSGMGSGHGSGGGMDDCVDDGDFIEIEVELGNTGILPEAEGEAEWEMNSSRVEFSVEIEDIPAGFYPLLVGGIEQGVIEAFEMHDGDVYGRIKFRDPETHGREHLDFEPRGQKIEVLNGGDVILEVEFPTE